MSILGDPSSKEHTTANCFAIRPALILFLVVLSFSVAIAQTKNCECKFDTKDYEAYGTHGACGIFMYNKAHSCEISFSGTGANANVLKGLLGDKALENQFAIAPQIFRQYVAYEREGQKGLFLDASFIENSLVVLARAALFRESTTKLPLKDIDTMVVDFSKKYSKQIAATFAGTAEPFEVKWEKESMFSVGRGYVELNFQQIAIVRVVYFSEKPR